jgi:addiction module RelB/DinJ family antitoxin
VAFATQPEIKEQAESILHRLGLSPTEAIRIFYTQIILRKGAKIFNS